MPEVLEVELTMRGIEHLAGRQVVDIERSDPLVVHESVDAPLVGSLITGFDRRGKQLVVLTDGPTIGVHLGMTGRILVDGRSAIAALAYGSRTDDQRWDRWAVRLDGDTTVRLHDPRRFARVVLDPDIGRLGPDVLSLRGRDLAAALNGRRAPLKAVLLDQHVVAGLGNLLVDEVLWWCGFDPRRPAGSLTPDDVGVLHRTIRSRLRVMLRRGGSHTGTLSPENRAPGGRCPCDGAEYSRGVVGGRTTVWCRAHQR